MYLVELINKTLKTRPGEGEVGPPVQQGVEG